MGYFDRVLGQADLDRVITQMNQGRAKRPRKQGTKSRIDSFEPGLLCDMDLLFSGETLSSLSQAELAIAKIDSLAGSSWMCPQLRRCLSRIEGIATYRPNGAKPDYRLCCYAELADWMTANRNADGDRNRQIVDAIKDLAGTTEAASRTANDSHLASRALDCLFDSFGPGCDLTADNIMSTYAAISSGASWEDEASMRRWDYRQKGHQEAFLDFFVPPAPRKLPEFLEDLAIFSNRDLYSPLARSAIAHYQIEITKMFTAGSDQIGRLVAVMIWRRAGIIEHIMTPFSLTPAMVTERHTLRLEPYLADAQFHRSRKTIALDNWVYHCAKASSFSVKVTSFCMKRLAQTYEKWVSTLGAAGMKTGRNTKRVLTELLGSPVVVIQLLVELTGLSFTTVAGIVDELVSAGILAQVRGAKRNRVYEAPDGLMLFKLIESALLPDAPVSREAIIEQSMRDLKG